MGYEFFGEKIIFPSAPVPGINNDQSLTLSKNFQEGFHVFFYTSQYVFYMEKNQQILVS